MIFIPQLFIICMEINRSFAHIVILFAFVMSFLHFLFNLYFVLWDIRRNCVSMFRNIASCTYFFLNFFQSEVSLRSANITSGGSITQSGSTEVTQEGISGGCETQARGVRLFLLVIISNRNVTLK